MDFTAVVAGVCSSLASLMTAYFAYRLSRSKQRNHDLAHERDVYLMEVKRCYRQIAAYYELERIACERLAQSTETNPTVVQIKLRDAVTGMGIERPAMTRNQAQRRLAELEC